MLKEINIMLGLPIELEKGVEVKLPIRLCENWLMLRNRLLVEAALHPTIPDYIIWNEFNKKGLEKDPEIVDMMAEIIAFTFAPTKPTHLLGIMDAGEDLTNAVGAFLKMKSEQVKFTQKLKEDSDKNTESYLARSYKSSGMVSMSLPNFTEKSRVLVVDDVAALFGVGGPAIRAVQKQGVKVVGFAVGMDKSYQGWHVALQKIVPAVPGLSVVTVKGIKYDNGTRYGKGKIILSDSTKGLRII